MNGAALDGVRVLDLSRFQPGAYLTRMLSDLGADVLRVEQPGAGDPLRGIPGAHEAYNRGKRSMTLDTRHERSAEVLRKLIANCDVVVESGRPGSFEAKGVGYAQLSAEQPRLIWCAITGFGQASPNIDRAGHDVTFLGYTGLLALMAGDTIPPTPDFVLAVPIGALMGVIGIMAALALREKTGKGKLVDTSIVDSATWILSEHVARVSGGQPAGWGPSAARRAYRCADGKLITLAATEARSWAALCKALDIPDLAGSMMVPPSRYPEVAARLEAIFATQPAAYWVDTLADAGAAVGPTHEIADLFGDRHVRARGSITEMGELKIVRSPLRLLDGEGKEDAPAITPPPELGEHTDAALSAAGFSAAEIAALRAAGAI